MILRSFSPSFFSVVLSKSSEALFKDASGFLISWAKSFENVSALLVRCCNSLVISSIDCVSLPISSFLMKTLFISIVWLDFFLTPSLNLTKSPIGLRIYLFKNREKIKITITTAIMVLIINAFLSFTAVVMSFACSETTI